MKSEKKPPSHGHDGNMHGLQYLFYFIEDPKEIVNCGGGADEKR